MNDKEILTKKLEMLQKAIDVTLDIANGIKFPDPHTNSYLNEVKYAINDADQALHSLHNKFIENLTGEKIINK